MPILQQAGKLLRRALGQQRHVVQFRNWWLIELRQGCVEHPDFLPRLSSLLKEQKGVSHVTYSAEIERLVVRCETDHTITERDWQRWIVSVEKPLNLNRAFFAARTRFPAEQDTRLRSLLEMGLDLSSFAGGLLMRQVNERTFRFFSDLSALSALLENSEDLRRPLDLWVGEDNSELVLRLVATFGESFSQGWSGSLVDLLHRLHIWQTENERQRCWETLQEQCLESLMKQSTSELLPSDRPVPLPDGPVEAYQSTADKLSLAAFSTGMAFSHNLTRSFATLFTSVPRPALRGQESFNLELIKQLSQSNILVLNAEALKSLDRLTCVVLDASWLQQTRRVISTVLRLDEHMPELQALDERIRNPANEAGDFRLESVTSPDSLTETVAEWWQKTSEPLESLYLVYRKKQLRGAILVSAVTDHATESLLSRIRQQGLKVHLAKLDPNEETESLLRVGNLVADLQRQGDVVLAMGREEIIQGADLAVGLLSPEKRDWTRGADLLVTDPMAALWALLEASDLGNQAARQSVEMARIEAFSGLILSLDTPDRRSFSRIRLAANLATLGSMVNGRRLARKVKPMPLSLVDDFTPWHAMDTDSVLERLQSAASDTTPARPECNPDQPDSFVKLWLQEMSSPLVPILLTGAGLAAFTGAVGDALLIGGVMALNGVVGGRQRQQTEQQLQSMGMKTEQVYHTLRGSQECWIPADELRPGDRIFLQTGDLVPADARVLKATHLETDESSLTGESMPVKKGTAPSFSLVVSERSSMLWEGTALVQGEAEAVVVVEQSRSESRRSQAFVRPNFNGVEARLERLTDLTVPVAAFSGVAILLSGLSRGLPVQEVVGSGVSLAVAAVPEGLPIMATMAQLASASRLGEKGALARNPRAIEALGRMSVLCADKTGTLTEGRLALRLIAVDGEIEEVDSLTEASRQVLKLAWMACPDGVGKGKSRHFTDEAVGRAVLDRHPELGEALAGWTRAREMPFKSERGYHATLWQHEDETKRLCVKGAPEIILGLCNRWKRPDGVTEPLGDDGVTRFTELAHSLADRGFRILAVAERPARSLTLDRSKVSNLVFRGFLALADPVRASAREAVAQLADAGIQVKMITGDHPVTACAIARELNMGHSVEVLTGAQIQALSDEELGQSCQSVSVFARVTPSQKARIVKALQTRGEVVGMTGDGANDAAAIRLAEVGIALGSDCSVAAQQAADLLVMDSRIETIVSAVLEGRSLWTAVRDAVALLVGGNLGEIGFTLIAGLLEGRSPLNARQLLLVNLLTDTLPALAVALRKPDKVKATQLMEEGPDASLGEALTREIQWRAGLTGSVTTFSWMLDRWLRGPERASTVALLTLIGSQLGQTLLAGKGSRDVLLSSTAALAALAVIVETPGLNRFFGCSRPGILGWTGAIGSVLASVGGAALLPKLEQAAREQESRFEERVRTWVSSEERV